MTINDSVNAAVVGCSCGAVRAGCRCGIVRGLRQFPLAMFRIENCLAESRAMKPRQPKVDVQTAINM
jgi:hypothetical protein